MIPATCVQYRRSHSLAVGIGEVDAQDHAIGQRRMIGGDAAVDHRHADAAAVDRAERLIAPGQALLAPVTSVVTPECERTGELPDTASTSRSRRAPRASPETR